MIDLGPLDRRIRIEQRGSTQDGTYGTPLASWTTYATLWATVEEIAPGRSESQSQGINIAERPARVKCRYVTGITPAMRAVYLDRSDRIMKITSPPIELGRKEGIAFSVADFTTAGNAE